MKKTILAILVLLTIFFTLGGSRPRYSPSWTLSHSAPYGIDMNDATIATAEIRGQNGETIDNVTDGNWDVSGAELVHDTDIVFSLKTIIKTVDITATGTTDDFNFDATAENSTAQNLDLGGLVPAWCEITSCTVRCFESVGAGTFQIMLGTASAGNQLLAQATVDANLELATTAATASPVVATTAAGKGVWLQGDPSGDWDEAGGTGRWAVMVTYIDYGAVYTAEGP